MIRAPFTSLESVRANPWFAKELGILKVGIVSIDGTKIDANALNIKSLRYDRIEHLREQLSQHGMMSEVFTFVDATHLLAKANLWEERDRAVRFRHEKLNNEILPKVAHDKQVRIGYKGKNKFWYGYKQHTSICNLANQ